MAGATTPLNTNFNVTIATGETLTFRTGSGGSATTGSGQEHHAGLHAEPGVGQRASSTRANVPLTCSGYDTAANQLTGCYWATAPAVNSVIQTHALSNAGQSLLGGFIKIERQNAAGAWSDVTTEILNLGFSAPNQEGTSRRAPIRRRTR